jgi:hypothetical protein
VVKEADKMGSALSMAARPSRYLNARVRCMASRIIVKND